MNESFKVTAIINSSDNDNARLTMVLLKALCDLDVIAIFAWRVTWNYAGYYFTEDKSLKYLLILPTVLNTEINENEFWKMRNFDDLNVFAFTYHLRKFALKIYSYSIHIYVKWNFFLLIFEGIYYTSYFSFLGR